MRFREALAYTSISLTVLSGCSGEETTPCDLAATKACAEQTDNENAADYFGYLAISLAFNGICSYAAYKIGDARVEKEYRNES